MWPHHRMENTVAISLIRVLAPVLDWCPSPSWTACLAPCQTQATSDTLHAVSARGQTFAQIVEMLERSICAADAPGFMLRMMKLLVAASAACVRDTPTTICAPKISTIAMRSYMLDPIRWSVGAEIAKLAPELSPSGFGGIMTR